MSDNVTRILGMLHALPEVTQMTKAIRAAHETLYRATTMVVPFIGLHEAPHAKAEERWDRTMGKMLGQVCALSVLSRTKPGDNPRETQIFKSMQEAFAEAVEEHTRGRLKMPYDASHAQLIKLLEGLSPGGDINDALAEAERIMRNTK